MRAEHLNNEDNRYESRAKAFGRATIAETSPNFREIPEEKERGEEIAKEFGMNGTV